MHLALLIGHFPPGAFGGAELQAEGWARRLADRHQVTVITRRDPPTQPARERRDGFEVVRLAVARPPGLRTLLDLRAIGRAVAALEPRPALLLCFQTFVSGLAGVLAGARQDVPVVVWIRGEAEYRLRPWSVHRHVGPAVWWRARGVLVQSEANRRALLAALERADPRGAAGVSHKLEVVGNGLELPPPPFAPGAGVLGVGRLIGDKGMDLLIEAAAAAGVPATIAGEGPERPRLERLAARRGGACRFAGFVARPELDALYRGAACVVLAARRGEGLPNVVLEAMAQARPVIATACAGAADLIVDGTNGLLVPPGDAGALAAALARLVGDPALAARLGAGARATAERFAWPRVRTELERVLARWAAP